MQQGGRAQVGDGHVDGVSGGLLEAKTNDQKFEAVVDDVKKAAVLIVGY
jgi:hypothetical protein